MAKETLIIGGRKAPSPKGEGMKKTKTIAISIPDDLWKRLQKVKHLIKVSGVCREAIEEALAEVEEFRAWKQRKKKS